MSASHPSEPGKPQANSIWLAPAGIVIALAGLNCATVWLFPDSAPYNEYFEAVLLGIWALQPLLLGVWTALGPGRLVTRAPIVVPCMMLCVVAPSVRPGGLDGLERSEFVIITVAAMAILAAMSGIMYVVRWLTGWRILIPGRGAGDQVRLQFDVKYLLALITLYAISLGITSNLEFEPPDPSPFFSPDFFMYVTAIGGTAISAILLPVIAVPFVVLRVNVSRRFVSWAVAFWAVVSGIMSMIGVWSDGGPWTEIVKWIVLIQLSGALLGAAAALTLRLAGFRLMSIRPLQSAREPIEP